MVCHFVPAQDEVTVRLCISKAVFCGEGVIIRTQLAPLNISEAFCNPLATPLEKVQESDSVALAAGWCKRTGLT